MTTVAHRGPVPGDPPLPRSTSFGRRRRRLALVLTTLALLLAELGTLLAAAPAAAQEVKPPLTVDGPGPCRRIGGE